MSTSPIRVIDSRASADGGPADLLEDLDELIEDLGQAESAWSDRLREVSPDHRFSARNMVHYWSIRQRDLRPLQSRLAALGLSSLGRSEPHVEGTLRAVRAAAAAMDDGPWAPREAGRVDLDRGREMLRGRTADLLGAAPADRETRIMVTLPSEAATDFPLVRELLERGMDVARINCAHDGPAAWSAMADHVRRAGAMTGRGCVIAMDLAGPKLRTGPIQPGPQVVKLRPARDALGRVVAPARAWLTSAENPAPAPEPELVTVPVDAAWLSRRQDGDVVRFRDTRGAKRTLVLTEPDPAGGGLLATGVKTSYLASGTLLHVEDAHDPCPVGPLPAREQTLLLSRGDVLTLTRDCAPAPADHGGAPRIGCTLPEVFDNARVGQTIRFDDGRIGGEIVAVDRDALRVRIDQTGFGGSKLGAAKGINVPDTHLPVPALTDKDVADLATVVEIADIVQMSFVQRPSDITRLHEELRRLGGERLGVVLKIETTRAFANLPQLLLTAMRRPGVGVMIARGDLAVEVGYERLAEVQEEILWLCEAAHLPVIWATQVLEQLAKSGLPSRAEISDAAMGERAECVMLNKGPHIRDAIRVLDGILRRMDDHHYKKNALLRQLRSWRPDAEG
ncbi:pyruvate kinase [Mycobacterium sp. IS-1742]|uniref:pyruvate kinase n=1 Tax=Mycobacterium sp. IS-1742 TaxID=1772285 RepID=UPI000740539C|nr:pyruvate kinase [Mycobacterium sp. IS-1742]KUI27532.1 pyruvate kinase [Mycobacterium sp. IS-1742]